MTQDPAVAAALEALRSIVAGQQPGNAPDLEADHAEADEILCILLTTLGYREVVEEWRKIDKWYA